MQKKKKKWWLVLIPIAIAAASVLLYINSSPSSRQPTAMMNSGSIEFTAMREHISNAIEVKGKTSYVKETWIHAPFASEVAAWHVKEGQHVEEGQLLFQLSDDKLRSDIEIARAQLLKRQLQAKLGQAQTNEASPPDISGGQEALAYHASQETARIQQQLDRLELSIAERELSDQEARLQQSAFTSPESGIFLFGDIHEPSMLQKDERVGKIVDLSQLQLISTVSEFEVFRIKEGMSVEVRIDALKDVKLEGTVAQVSKFAKSGAAQGSSSAQFEVIISLDSYENLIAGLSLTGKIITESKDDALVVPTIAVMREEERHYVWMPGELEAEKRYVRIGMETADKTEIVDGLSEGDVIVLR